MSQLLLLIVVVFLVMACVVAAMSIGVLFTGREIKGSCGGVGGGDCACSSGERANCTTGSTVEDR